MDEMIHHCLSLYLICRNFISTIRNNDKNSHSIFDRMSSILEFVFDFHQSDETINTSIGNDLSLLLIVNKVIIHKYVVIN